jgi:ATP-binding protein involved in chromosome partitioning
MAKDADVNFLGALPLEIDIRTDVDEGTPTALIAYPLCQVVGR